MTRVPVDVARSVVAGYLALAIVAARGLYLTGRAGQEAFAPHAWPWVFGVAAVLLAWLALRPTSRPACLGSGAALHAAFLGRLWATRQNDLAAQAAGTVVPGRVLVALSFYAVILLSSSLVWRYLLWPTTRR